MNFINWIVREGNGVVGGGLLLGAPITHKIYGCSLAMHVHGVAVHVHLSNHSKIVIPCGLS